jgi:putative ABC transport system permease protein
LPLDSPTPIAGRAQVLAVLDDGSTRIALNDCLRTVSRGLRARGLLEPDRQLVSADPIQRRWGRQFATALYAMLGAIGLVLLVACVNVVNLQLARQADRELDFALQAAMGATGAQLALQVLLESALLASLGAVGGWMVARVLLQVLLELAPERLTMVSDAANLDWTVVVFAGGVATLVCVAIGAVPAWRAGRADLVSMLKGQSSGGERRTSRWQSTLIVGQLALALVLLTGAGLLLSSFVKLLSVDPGFDPAHMLAFEIQLPEARYQAPGTSVNLLRQLTPLVERIDGVSHATFCDAAPPMAGSMILDGHPEVDGVPRDGASGLNWPASTVAPDYFSTMGIAMVEGRSFQRADPAEVVIVNDLLARRFWGHTSPIGHRFRLDASQPWRTVVGVTRDVKVVGPDDWMGEGMELYYPYPSDARSHFFTLLLRATGDESTVVRQVKALLWSLDAGVPVIEAKSMEERLGDSIAEPRFYLRLCVTFAGIAVLLAGVGVYGTAVYWVTRRRRVFGIQMALGATRQHIVGVVLRRSAWLAVVGGALGIALSLAASTVLRSLLFKTDSRDPGVLIAVTALLAALVVVASLIPALRASLLDPATVLRQD